MPNYDTASGQLAALPNTELGIASGSPSGHDLAATALNDIDRFLSVTKERLERNVKHRDYLNQLIAEDAEAIDQLTHARDNLRQLFAPKATIADKPDYKRSEAVYSDKHF